MLATELDRPVRTRTPAATAPTRCTKGRAVAAIARMLDTGMQDAARRVTLVRHLQGLEPYIVDSVAVRYVEAQHGVLSRAAIDLVLIDIENSWDGGVENFALYWRSGAGSTCER